MELEEGMVRKIAVSVAAVGAFVALVVAVGSAYGQGETLAPTGGLALVAVIALFVVAMGAVGLFLARRG